MGNSEGIDEKALQELGARELWLEDQTKKLLAMCRDMGRAGKVDEADRLWKTYETVRDELRIIKDHIQWIEARFYGQRSRRQ